MSCRFLPPTELVVPPVDAESNVQQRRSFGYYPSRPRGRTVWKLVDGTFTFDQPYPSYILGDTTSTSVGSNNNIQATYETVYYGGHEYIVDNEECGLLETFLTEQGYTSTDWITHSGDILTEGGNSILTESGFSLGTESGG